MIADCIAEQHGKACRGKARERILIAQGAQQRANDDESKQRDQNKAKRDAEFLRRHREDKVGVALRQDAASRCPRPDRWPNHPPRIKLSVAMSILKVSPERRVEEALNAARDVRHGEIGAGQGRRAATAASPNTQTSRMPAMKNSAPHTSSDQHGLAEVRLHHQQRDDEPSSDSARALVGISGRFADSPNSQATMMTKAGLRNSDG